MPEHATLQQDVKFVPVDYKHVKKLCKKHSFHTLNNIKWIPYKKNFMDIEIIGFNMSVEWMTTDSQNSAVLS
jgi:hypothetical protein